MPNEVYKAAVKGLGALVAPKAARRLVDEALRASNRTSDDVSEAAMRRLLLTRVRRELEGIFPEHVVTSSLERVAAELGSVSANANRRGFFRSRRAGRSAQGSTGLDQPVAEERADEPSGPNDLSVKRSSVYLPAVDLPEHLPPPGGSRSMADQAAHDGRAQERSTGEAGARQRRRPSTGLSVPVAMVEHVIRTFAELETVRQIVVVDGMEVTQVRGEGLATDRLAALTVATKGLLARAGDLRVFSLEFHDGVLFLFPTHEGAIVVLTQPKVNIGAVLAARAVLEEAA